MDTRSMHYADSQHV